jgi:hypothetical protein
VGLVLCGALYIPFVTETASLDKMRVVVEQRFVYEKSLVHFIRLNWRRRSRSPFPFAALHPGGLEKGFHDVGVGMALYAGDFIGGISLDKPRCSQGTYEENKRQIGDLCLHAVPLIIRVDVYDNC